MFKPSKHEVIFLRLFKKHSTSKLFVFLAVENKMPEMHKCIQNEKNLKHGHKQTELEI